MLARNCQSESPKTSQYTTEDDTTDWESICHECRQVDWDSLPGLPEQPRRTEDIWRRPSMHIRPIEANHEQLATSACKICRILSSLKPPDLDTVPCRLVAERIVVDGAMKERILPFEDEEAVTVLFVFPEGKDFRGNYQPRSKHLIAIPRARSGSDSRAISPKSIDYSRLRHLIQQCVEEHSSHCNVGAPSRLPGLRVIDVTSRTVIEAPTGCLYVALSYVWGQQDVQSPGMDLQRPPPLIEDAITVTLSMGYQYLWIDRYCIPQNDGQERHRMISRMDQVYSSASVTIIDASGKDAQSGLPGVSNLARQSQRQVHIGNATLLELPRGYVEVEKSTWATRGWTYQEGYFSPRRLIFTLSQVLYICASTYREESTYCLLGQESPGRQILEIDHLFPTSRHLENEGKPGRHSIWIALDEYSKRDLTYQHDSLNGFLGILNSYTEESNSSSTPKILHVSWGLFAKYKGKDKLIIGLNWFHKSPAQRRPHFPSWTWAGWGGRLESTGTEITLQRPGEESAPLDHLRWQLFLNFKDDMFGDIWDLADHVWRSWSADRGRLPQQPSYATQLQITCLVVPACFQKLSLTRDQERQMTELHFGNKTDVTRLRRERGSGDITAVLQIWDGIYIAAKTFLDQDPGGQDCIIGLLFTSVDTHLSDGSVKTFSCLLARQLDEGLYERVGIVPEILDYHGPIASYRSKHGYAVIFLDEKGSILDKVRVQEGEKESPFMAVGQRQTIVLV